EGDVIMALRAKLTKIGETMQGDDIILHVYSPDYQAMGDCMVCGHDQHVPWHLLEKFKVEHDGFEGVVIGQYKTLEGKRGVVLQQTGTRVAHVYSERFIKSKRGTRSPSLSSPLLSGRGSGSGYWSSPQPTSSSEDGCGWAGTSPRSLGSSSASSGVSDERALHYAPRRRAGTSGGQFDAVSCG